MRADTLPIRTAAEADVSVSARPARGWTVADVAQRYRVSPDRVRAWIRRGELIGINTAEPCRRPRWIVTREALELFEARRRGGPPPKTPRRQRRHGPTDYYPDMGPTSRRAAP